MDTYEIAKLLKLTSQLMELHGENPFKVKSLANAAFKLDKTGINLKGLSEEELFAIDGVGKGIAHKIIELQKTGELKELNDLLKKTPPGVIEMMSIKGIGPKKVAQLWKELEIESVGELLYACHENRLLDLKGFGTKTQELVKKAIEFKMANAGKFHYANVEQIANELVDVLKKELDTKHISFTGAIRRKEIVIDKIEVVAASEKKADLNKIIKETGVKIDVIYCEEKNFAETLFKTTATEKHLEKLHTTHFNGKTEKEIYNNLDCDYIEPELREGNNEIELARKHHLPKLIEITDLKGILHNHTTYSDGIHTLHEMASYCKELGYEYLGICDHSQSAFYANGLKPERIIEQHKEIDELNDKLAPFKILKGIESDILNDGSLDYPDEILNSFDLVVASVHSNLKMDIHKATSRLIKAIENPFTTILGHPTGRLLLSREGYPIDHKKVIDACAANNVIIELNSHPYRLDIDWSWVPYCIEKGVKISINPDAHEKEGYHDMYFGTCAARKGMLTKEMCFNALSLKEIQVHLTNKKAALNV